MGKGADSAGGQCGCQPQIWKILVVSLPLDAHILASLMTANNDSDVAPFKPFSLYFVQQVIKTLIDGHPHTP